MTRFTNKWTVTLEFDVDMDRKELVNYLDSCLDFDILDSYVVRSFD